MPTRDRTEAPRALVYASAALLVWIVFLWRLGYASLLDPDEAHYAQLTREMLRAGNLLVPLLDGVPFIDKPVLFHWLQGAAIVLLGESAFAARLPSALAALALLATTRWLGTALFDRATGNWSALMLATMPASFILGRIGLMDMVYTALLFGGVACLAVAALRGPRRLQYPGYLLLGLATATKGPVVFVLGGLAVAGALASGRPLRAAVRSLSWPAGLLIALLVAAPWFLWMWLTFGDHFIRAYVFLGNLHYFTNPVSFSTRVTSPVFYGRIFLTAFFPWSIVLIGQALDAATRGRRPRPGPEVAVLLVWMVVVFGFFSAARFRLDHYVYPAAPACCILAARAWLLATEDASRRWSRLVMILTAGLLVGGGAIAGVALFRINLGLDATAVPLPVALVLGGGVLGWQILRRQALLPAPTALLVTLGAAYAMFVAVGFPVLEHSRPSVPLGRWVAQHAPADATIGTHRLSEWKASLRYYADRPLEPVESPADIASFLDRHPGGYVLLLAHHRDAMQNEGIALETVARAPLIIGRTGRYLRSQVWGEMVVARRPAGPAGR